MKLLQALVVLRKMIPVKSQIKTLFSLKKISNIHRNSKNVLWILGVLSGLLACTNNASAAVPIVWATSAMNRIMTYTPAEATKTIELYAARGEYEPFQIVVRAPESNLTGVNVTVSDLTGPNGQIISKNNLTLYRESYSEVTKPSPTWGGTTNFTQGAGWYPDGLIPFLDPVTKLPPTSGKYKAAPFNVIATRNQPIWVDVLVPRTAQPGKYTGKYVVTSGTDKVEGTIVLNVWNFTLPVKPSLQSSFQFWSVKTKQANQLMLEHRLMPKDTNPSDQRELIDKLGHNAEDLGFWSGANMNTCTMQPAPSVSTLKSAAATNQPDLPLYNYTVDEIDQCSGLIEPVKQWARNLHQAGINNLAVMTPNPLLYNDGSGTGRSAVDIWAVSPYLYNNAPTRISEALSRGHKVWSYNDMILEGFSPKWLVDFSPINHRIIQGMINQSLGLTGLLYWRVDLWTSDPWNNIQNYTSGGYNYPGEGMLVYPGADVGINGVVPSMRLKWMREGVDDYEYIEILKNKGRKDWALQVSRQSGTDWKNWSKDYKVLESVRRQLGNEIHRLNGG